MNKPRYLTKSRFKLAMECPTKLFYTGKEEYSNKKLEDSFLEALAEGGYQVGELAKCYFPGGHDIFTYDYNKAVSQTEELLKQDDVIIYEAAIRAGSLFVRADILVKTGKQIQLIEVKAKSFDSSEQNPFLGRGGYIKSTWKPYLYDVAFQKYVMSQAFPDYDIQSFLMLADKSAECPTNGLNQKFKMFKDEEGIRFVLVSPRLEEEDLSPQILSKVNVDSICDLIYTGKDSNEEQTLSFIDRINLYAEYYAKDMKIESPVSIACKDCEFCGDANNKNLKSGKQECWTKALRWTEDDFNCPTIFDIWDLRSKAELIDSGIIKVSDIIKENISPQSDDKPGISRTERQWLQVEKIQKNDSTAWIDKENMTRAFESWTYPLHFIDFETSMVAIPFTRGRHPYEGIAFQYSHHMVHDNGEIEHRSEFLFTQPLGDFPNYHFVRALKLQLEFDNGTIFMYSPHENTYLNLIYQQLHADHNAPDDRDDLCQFIRKITKSSSSSSETWIGERCMVDMLEMVKRFYYDPATNGSNSIKQVLPAILNNSTFLKEKYSQPIYGADGGIKSYNFKDWTWIKFEDGAVVDPYKLLPKMFTDVSDNDLAIICNNDEIKDGGAALTAYGRIQFEDMSHYERKEIEDALSKYCELDTFAMVMIYEGWKDMLSI